MQLFEITEPNTIKSETGWVNQEVPTGVTYYLEGGIAKIRMAIGRPELDVVADETVSQDARIAMGLGYTQFHFGKIERRGAELLLVANPPMDHSSLAVVLLSTAPGENGQIQLTSNTWEEVEGNSFVGGQAHRRVQRNWKEFPSAGVGILNLHQLEVVGNGFKYAEEYQLSQQPPLLLKMIAGSSFKVWRTGNVDSGARNFSVHWDGRILRTNVPQQKNYDE